MILLEQVPRCICVVRTGYADGPEIGQYVKEHDTWNGTPGCTEWVPCPDGSTVRLATPADAAEMLELSADDLDEGATCCLRSQSVDEYIGGKLAGAARRIPKPERSGP
jgi:hypothetical protein